MKACRDFWKWVKDGNVKQQHEFHLIDDGDEYNHEEGELCRVWFSDKKCFEFGFIKTFEWDEDCAEPDTQIVFRCWDITDPDSNEYLTTVKWEDVYNKLTK